MVGYLDAVEVIVNGCLLEGLFRPGLDRDKDVNRQQTVRSLVCEPKYPKASANGHQTRTHTRAPNAKQTRLTLTLCPTGLAETNEDDENSNMDSLFYFGSMFSERIHAARSRLFYFGKRPKSPSTPDMRAAGTSNPAKVAGMTFEYFLALLRAW